MTARASFTLCLALASLPLAAGLFGVYQLWTLRAVDLDAAALAEFCLIAYERTVDTAGHVVIYAAIGLLLFLLACGLVAIFRGWRETRRITRLPPASTESAKWATVQQFGARHLPRRRIELFAAPEPMAITVGYVSPRILLSSGLLDVLDESELEAVLHHEAAHVRMRDPLRAFLSDACRTALPFIPIVRYAASHFQMRKEVEADVAAVSAMGSPAPLASALIKVLSAMPSEEAFGVGVTPTEARIDALLGKPVALESSGRRLLVSALSLPVLALLSMGFYLLAHSPHIDALHVCPV